MTDRILKSWLNARFWINPDEGTTVNAKPSGHTISMGIVYTTGLDGFEHAASNGGERHSGAPTCKAMVRWWPPNRGDIQQVPNTH